VVEFAGDPGTPNAYDIINIMRNCLGVETESID